MSRTSMHTQKHFMKRASSHFELKARSSFNSRHDGEHCAVTCHYGEEEEGIRDSDCLINSLYNLFRAVCDNLHWFSTPAKF